MAANRLLGGGFRLLAQGNATRPDRLRPWLQDGLEGIVLVEAGPTEADLTGCRIYGVSAQCLKLEGAKQQYLVVTSYGEPEITVDNIEVAQFVYLLLHNEKIRDVVDTIGKKGVLLSGPPCHPVARIQRRALRHHVRVVTGRSGC
jgi:hypothetical protein